MPTIQDMKEREVLETPVLLFECEFRDGHVERWATHKLSFDGDPYRPALLNHTAFDIRSSGEDGIDAAARIAVTLANADSYYSQLERAIGWKGARLTIRFVFFDLINGVAATEPSTIFRGVANSPDSIRESELRLTFNNRLNFHRVFIPETRIQKRCPWVFPASALQRTDAITGGLRGGFSSVFKCGYSAGEPGGVGNMNGAVPFTSCDYTRASCEQRGMFRADSGNNGTRRFGGIEFVPSTILVRSYGEKSSHASGAIDNEAKYNDFVPIIYGTAWVQPPVTLARNDGNLTRMEVLIGAGEISNVLKIIVNDIEIPLAQAGRNMTSTGWYNIVSLGNRTGDFNLDFVDGSGAPAGDPYGSLAYLSLVVPNRIQDGRSLPKVQALVEGLKLQTFDVDESWTGDVFTNNPAWVILDVLRRAGWNLSEIDLQSFAETALYCADPIDTTDLHGNAISIPRFQCNLALQKRRSAADVIRGVRNCAGLYLTFGSGGRLQLRMESTFAVQHPSKPGGSNAIDPLLAGWPAYEFGDGSTAAGAILRTGDGQSTVRLYSRTAADAPNRFTAEFQDAFNEYQQDSISLVDADDVQTSGQETSAAIPALGLANFDQATRMVELQLLKSVKGNQYIEFESSVKGLGLQPGDLITVTYTKEGLLRTPFRIIRLAPSLNYRRVAITAQLHDDSWYVRTAGNGAESTGRQPKYELGLPRPLIGTELDDFGQNQFGITETYVEGTDGTSVVTLSASFSEPSRPAASNAGIPLLSLSTETQSSGGSLSGDQTLYYAVTGSDTDGIESGLSFIVRAVVPPGSATNKVVLAGLSFSAATTSFNVYRGHTPQQLTRIAADVSLAVVFEDTGLPDGLAGPPDENYSHANFYWRFELLGLTTVETVTSATVGNSTLNMNPNEYRGAAIRILRGKGAGQELRIASNSATAIAIEGTWGDVPDTTSVFVIAEQSWILGATSAHSPVSFPVPNREGSTVQISGRSANANDKECIAALSPLTRWRLLGAAGVLLDNDIPGDPHFALSAPGDGTLEMVAVGFSDLANTRTVSAATLTLHYWNERNSPSTVRLAAAALIDDATVTLDSPGGAVDGSLLQAGEEIMMVTAVSSDQMTYTITRGAYSSPASAHSAREVVYHLEKQVHIVAFGRDFFGSPASGSFVHSIYAPGLRIAAGEMFATNNRGNSPTKLQRYTANGDEGLRTLSGGQLSLQIDGFLAIEDNATPALVIENELVIRDIYAVVQRAPTEAPSVLRLRQDDDAICTLTIPVGAKISNVVDGFGLRPLRSGALLQMDILSVGQTATSTPGSDLTVTIRL